MALILCILDVPIALLINSFKEQAVSSRGNSEAHLSHSPSQTDAWFQEGILFICPRHGVLSQIPTTVEHTLLYTRLDQVSIRELLCHCDLDSTPFAYRLFG